MIDSPEFAEMLSNLSSVLELFLHYCRSVVMQSAEIEVNFEFPPWEFQFTFTLLSITSAFSDLADTRRHCHYCAMQFGVFTIVSFIEKVPDKYHQCLVYPTGGKIDIPDCKDQLDLNPPGLLRAFKEKNQSNSKTLSGKNC